MRFWSLYLVALQILILHGIFVQSIFDVTDLLLAVLTISSTLGTVGGLGGLALGLLRENLLLLPSSSLGGTSGSGNDPPLRDLGRVLTSIGC